MINDVSIVISTVMVMYIVWRAIRFDRTLPWFETRSLYEQAKAQRTAAKVKAARSRKLGVPEELLRHANASTDRR